MRPHSSPAEATAYPHAAQRGTIEVAPQAITTLAGRALADCPGVVGIADKHLRFGAADLLPAERYARGAEVHFVGDRIVIDLYLVLDYGVQLAEVAQEAITRVKAAVETMLGLPIVQVNVIVQGLRVSDPNA
jgi:uncharacterized alkaline shock family protein YloU